MTSSHYIGVHITLTLKQESDFCINTPEVQSSRH